MTQREAGAHTTIKATPQDSVQDGKVFLNAESLKALRKRRGLSQDALAQLCLQHRLCVSIASIKRAETGKAVLYRTASHLARVYASDLHELISRPAADPTPAAGPGAFEAEEQRNVLGLLLVMAEPLPAALAAEAAAMIAQFGGRQERPELAVFGLPRAYGSDAVRCLQCAIGLAQLLQGRRAAIVIGNREWPLAAGDETARPDLPQRPDRNTLLNADVSTTPPVYVERGLGTHLGERFVFEPSGHVDDLLCLAHERHALRGAQYPLIGRHVEVQQFKATLETTLAYQCGHILYLRGVAGIGKSRLIQEFTDIAVQNQFACHAAMVLDFGVRGNATPFGQLVGSLLGVPPGTVPSEAELAAHMREVRLPDELAMHYRTLLGMPQPAAGATLFGAMAHAAREMQQVEAIRQLIMHRAVERPLLLVLEDIHWSSPALIATLVGLLPDVQEAPLIWLLSSRFEQDPLEHTLRPYLNGLPVTMLDLATLRGKEALAMARHASDPDPEFHAQCVARAQGNPLFLTQLLLAGRGQALPGSLQNLVQSKLDQLPAPQRRGLRVASAIGQYFSLAFLRDVLQQPDHDVLDCVRQYIVRPTEQGNYVFVHDLVMQGIYESMPAGQREEIHLAVAACYGTGAPDLRAGHLHKARDPRAPAALLAVIGQRIASYAYHPALELVKVCRDIDYAPRDEYRLQLLSGQCHAKIGQTQHAREAFAAALALAGDQPQRVAAVIGLATALNVLEDLVAEEILLDEAIDAARAAGVEEGLAELYYLKGNIYFPAGDFARSRELHELSQRFARSKDTEARALSGIGDSYYAQGRIVTAHKVFRACLALCEEHGLADIEASNRFMLGTVKIYLNQTGDGLVDALASAEQGRKVGNRRAEIVSRLTAGWALLSTGRAAEARHQVEQGLALAEQIGATRFEPFLNESMVRVLLLEGQPGAAHALALRAWETVERQNLHKFIGPWVLSTLALVEPSPRARDAALAGGQALIDQGCVAHNVYRFHVSAIETCLLHGQAEAARALAGRFAARVEEEPFPWASHHIALARHSADWLELPSPAHQAVLHQSMQAGHAAGLGWVMPLWRQRLAQSLPLPPAPG
jgi:tetratricopeptide (TPR) repeat protein/transcriptional regulator with XRE-family HTH domain